MKNILITGGTAGLGRALALQFESFGANVAVVGRNPEKLAALKRERPSIKTIQGDVSDKNQIHRIFAEAIEAIGDPDTLINNASTLGPQRLSLLLDTDCEDLAHALETNLIAPFRLTKLVLPAMLLKVSGTVVNISSDAAIQNYSMWGAYSVSKSALGHLTRIFEAELEGQAVRFFTVDPGDMRTDLHLQAIPGADVTKLYDPADSAARLIRLLQSNETGAAHRGLR